MVGSKRRRQAVERAQQLFDLTERRACRALGFPRATHRYRRKRRKGETVIVREMKRLASVNPRFGYRRIYALMRRDGWNVNRKRIQRLWREEGMQVPQSSRKRQRVGFVDGRSVYLRAEKPNDCWCYDFIFDQTEDGRSLKILTILDEFTRECLAIKVGRGLKSEGVVQALEDLFLTRGAPKHVRSDNGPEFVAKAVKDWLQVLGVGTVYIEPGSPWENPFAESFHSRLRDIVRWVTGRRPRLDWPLLLNLLPQRAQHDQPLHLGARGWWA